MFMRTCERTEDSTAEPYVPQCYYGENQTDISDLMACCAPCCERQGSRDLYKWCADMNQYDVTCPPDDVNLTEELSTPYESTAFPDINLTTESSNEVSSSPGDCFSIYSNGEQRDGVYSIAPESTPVEVYCDMTTAGGGWTVIQSRVNGDDDFNRTWAAYDEPFGDAHGNFWIGLENIHTLTSQATELYIELEDFTNVTKYARYSRFSIGDASSLYRLSISGFSGDAGDSMTRGYYNLNGNRFSTWDRDNDD